MCLVLFPKCVCFSFSTGSFFIFFLQVHFVPEGGTVAQIVYSDEQDRPSQQVVYTADGTSYTSVDTSEHTLVYIHPVEATQACVVLTPPYFGT